METKLLHSEITEKILHCFFTVNKNLTRGLSTSIYINALTIEFEYSDLIVKKNYSIELEYRNKKVGELNADFLINEKVIVLVVGLIQINKETEDYAKLLMKDNTYEVCIVLNQSGDTDYKRIIFTNNYKKTNGL
jgi:GxxExxY protein